MDSGTALITKAAVGGNSTLSRHQMLYIYTVLYLLQNTLKLRRSLRPIQSVLSSFDSPPNNAHHVATANSARGYVHSTSVVLHGASS